jgi:glycosyltransferase involved in cell wall biosynthesis
VRQQARAFWDLPPDAIAIGAIGALVPRKGHRILVDAMALTTDKLKTSAVRCVIAGAGPLHQTLLEEIIARGLQQSMKLSGSLADPTSLLAALDIFVMPSLHEGLGVAALEAMAMGLPVIASAVGGLKEVVNNAHNGILVESGNPAKLAEAIIELAGNSQKRREIGVEGRKIAVENYSIKLMARRTLELYATCLAERSKAKTLRRGWLVKRWLNQPDRR